MSDAKERLSSASIQSGLKYAKRVKWSKFAEKPDSYYLEKILGAINSDGIYLDTSAADIAELCAAIIVHRYFITKYGVEYIGGIDLTEE